MKTRHLDAIVLARPFPAAPTVLHAPRGACSRRERALALRGDVAKYNILLEISYQVAGVEPPAKIRRRCAALALAHSCWCE